MRTLRLSLLVLPLLLGCASTPTSSSEDHVSSDPASTSLSPLSETRESSDIPSSSTWRDTSIYPETTIPSSSEAEEKPLWEQFFDHENQWNIKIEGTDEVWSFVDQYQNDHYGELVDAYVPVNVTISFQGEDYSFEESGLRMKGNTSRHHFFSDGLFTDFIHMKLSFKATFDGEVYADERVASFAHDWRQDPNGRKARKNRNFLGLEKLDLKFVPRNMGECVLREIYCYDTFREEGIMAPQASLCNVAMFSENSSLEGTYEMIEPVDKEFLKRRLGKDDAKGDLYKCVYNAMGKADLSRGGAIEKDGSGSAYNSATRIPNGKIGVEDPLHGYFPCYQLKTNDDLGEESDFSKMAGFIAAMWDCVYGKGDASWLESKIDVEEFLRFSAVSFLLGNFDDQRYDYNNYYLYFLPSNGKAIYIPYDWDWSLGADLGHDLSHKGPLERWTLDGGSEANVFLATFLPNDDSRYDHTPYITGYLNEIQHAKERVLNTEKYRAFAAKYGMENSAETQGVIDYMNDKAAHCA